MADPPTHKRETVLLGACAFLCLGIFYLLMLDKWGLSLWGHAIDYTRFGTWSQAISGIGTTSAVIIALASLYSQRSIHLAAESRRRLEEETAVFQWITSKEVRDENHKLIGRIWDITIQNSTVAPIYQWKVTFGPASSYICNHLKRPLLPGANVFNLPFFDNVEVSNTPEPTLFFEGRSGRAWSRSARGVTTHVQIQAMNCEHTSLTDTPA
jgi:hypothetical protein